MMNAEPTKEDEAKMLTPNKMTVDFPTTKKAVKTTFGKMSKLVLQEFYDVEPSMAVFVGLWHGAAAFIGYEAFYWYHGDFNPDCFVGTLEPPGLDMMSDSERMLANYTLTNGTTLVGPDLLHYGKEHAPSCNPYDKSYYIALGVIGAMLLGWLYEMKSSKAIQMPFSTATWRPSKSMFSLDDEIEIENSRFYQYFGHSVSAILFFILWMYIDGDSNESKALVHDFGRVVTGFSRFWIVFWPTCVAELTTLRSNSLTYANYKAKHGTWAFYSILFKVFVVWFLHFVLDPQTQMLWMHRLNTDDSDDSNDFDDSTSQQRWVIGITSVLGLSFVFFWYKYLAQRYVEFSEELEDGQIIGRLQNRIWAYVDFPTNLTLVAMIAYNVTARLESEHGNTHLPADFHAGVLYLILVAIGIFNVPVNKMVADWKPENKNTSEEESNKNDADKPEKGNNPLAKFNASLARAGKQVATVHMKKPVLKKVCVDDNL